MKRVRLGVVGLSLLILAGCSTSQSLVQINYDAGRNLSGYRTYALLPVGDQAPEDHPAPPELVAAATEGVPPGLVRSGLTPAPKELADVWIDIYGDATREPDYYWRETARTSRGNIEVQYVDSPHFRDRTKGTLVIELIERSSGTVVWRGARTRQFYGQPTPALIRSTVTEILAAFPPAGE